MSDLKMPDINEFRCAGRITRDPELRYLPNGTPVCKFGVAISRKYKTKEGDRKEETTYVDFECWKGTAEFVGQHLKKGRPILVSGSLKTDSWEDKATGQNQHKLFVKAKRVQTLDWDGKDAQGGTSAAQPATKPQPRVIEEPIPEDDVPF